MRQRIIWMVLIAIFSYSCAKQPRLPENSKYNVHALHNDSTWYGTGKAIRIFEAGSAQKVKQFNMIISTDIPFPGRLVPDTSTYVYNGCIEDCRASQKLLFYNIPLKKGKYKVAKLDKKRVRDNERASYWLVGYAGGAYKWYKFEGRNPGWVRITSFDKKSQILEGRFAISLDEDLTLYNRLINEISPIVRFDEGLFRVKLTDVKLK